MGDDDKFTFHDLAPTQESFRDAVIAGLGREPKSLPCKFFYDARGSALFEKICELPEYYLTRTEIAILDRFAADIATQLGPHCRLIELGSGASQKVRILLEALDKPAAYVAVDISREQLRQSAARLAADFPKLAVVAVCADYTRPFELPPLPGPDGKRVGFFPGSTIGNFEPQQVVAFLADWAALLGAAQEEPVPAPEGVGRVVHGEDTDDPDREPPGRIEPRVPGRCAPGLRDPPRPRITREARQLP